MSGLRHEVTHRTGHMGDTSSPRGGSDALEGVFGDGRKNAVCGSPASRRTDGGTVQGIRRFSQDRRQDLRSLSGMWHSGTPRSRRPHRYGHQREHSSWGARKIRERLIRRFSGIKIPGKSTIPAVLDRHGLFERRSRVRRRARGTALSLGQRPQRAVVHGLQRGVPAGLRLHQANFHLRTGYRSYLAIYSAAGLVSASFTRDPTPTPNRVGQLGAANC
jgi:hypothetical protein